jgi:AraC-like DNA-binding protein
MLTQATTPVESSLEKERQQLADLIRQLTTQDGAQETAIEELVLFRSDTPTKVTPVVYEPAFCVLVQGSKVIYCGDETIHYNALQYLLVPVMMPVAGKIHTASSTEPYFGVRMGINMRELTDLIIDTADHGKSIEKAKGLNVGQVDQPLLNALHRLVQLSQRPIDIPVMLPLLRREILYRLLQGEQGSLLRDFTRIDSQAHRIASVIELITQRFDQTLRVKELAEKVHLSESALFQAFKAVTTMSPMQFQKQLRLNEARRIMLNEGTEAATASYKVGYESPSQFSREYSRLFGASPKADVARFRQEI